MGEKREASHVCGLRKRWGLTESLLIVPCIYQGSGHCQTLAYRIQGMLLWHPSHYDAALASGTTPRFSGAQTRLLLLHIKGVLFDRAHQN